MARYLASQLNYSQRKHLSYPDVGVHGARGEDGEATKMVNGYLQTGETREGAGDYGAALDAYLAAWKKEAGNPEVAAALLREEFLLKTYPRSVQQLATIAAPRQEVRIWRLLARVCEVKGDYEQAIAFLREAIQAQPNDVASLSILARVFEKRDGVEAAVPWHRRILQANPQVRASQFFLARWHYVRGDYAEALLYFERVFLKERSNRACELYWLLANAHCHGIRGLEKHLAAVEQWRDINTEERPLTQELFVLAGKLSLDEGDLLRAERYLLHAYRLMPSQEVRLLLAVLEEQKKDLVWNPDDGDPQVALHQGETDLDAFIISWATSLQEAKGHKRRTSVKRIGLGVGLMLSLLGGIYGYRLLLPSFETLAFQWHDTPTQRETRAAGVQTESAPSFATLLGNGAAVGSAQAELETFPLDTQENFSLSETDLTEAPQTPQLPAEDQRQGKVVLASGLGIRVAGKGAKDPNRSPAAIQQAVEEYLTELQAAYEKARMTDPLLLGSLVLDLSVEASGQVSRVRLQSTKLPNKNFQEAVLSLTRKWRFPQAVGAVKVSYPLLFLPPGMDTASILTWEKYTAPSRVERENSSAGGTLRSGENPLQREPVKEERRINKLKLAATHPLGIYRVISSTPLRNQPRVDAQILSYLQARTQVTVVGMSGEYLEVWSVQGKLANGYVHWEDVVFLREQG